MPTYTFKLPDVGEGIAESEIAQWRVAVGDVVKEDQPLVDMLTEKAAVEIPSPVAGKVLKLYGAVGDKVPVGGVLVTLETAGALDEVNSAVSSGAKPAAQPTAAPRADASSAATDDDYFNAHPAAAPSARRRARELGVDLHRVRGSGRSGRVLHEDVERTAAGGGKPAVADVTVASAPVLAPTDSDRVEQIKVVGLRRKIAEAMQRSKQRIPHFAYVEELDVTELESFRSHLNDRRKAQQPKLTLLPFLIRALVRTLPEFPQVNARFDDEAGVIYQYGAVHVGIATQTPNGLMVPVVRHAEALDLWGTASEILRLAEVARAGKATRQELTGSTITITSLGRMGGIASTPIINAPEVAIVGVNKIVERPVVFNGHIAVRWCMNISSSFDHRVVDGWGAATFVQRVKVLLEHPAMLFA